MSSSFRFRLFILSAVMLMATVVIGFLAHRTWTRTRTVRTQFNAIQRESAWLASRLASRVQALNACLLRYKLTGKQAEWDSFARNADTLHDWLIGLSQEFHSDRETQLILQILAALESYTDAARQQALTSDNAQLDEITQKANLLLTLGLDLSEAHEATLTTVLSEADRAVTDVQWSTFAALAVLIVVATASAWIVYRDSIAPLTRELQESKRQLDRHEKLASLGVLSAGIAHEIRNPLMACKARLFTLRKSVAASASNSAVEDVDVINSEVDRLERIVRTFLKFARPADPNLAPIDLDSLLARVKNLTAPQWAPKGVQIVVAKKSGARALGDVDQLEQVLLNLVQNAAEAMSSDGCVTISAGANSRSTVFIEVADTGPGIPPEIRSRLFDPFFTTKANGTGLGLALSARLLEKQNGSIRFDSTVGSGTTFTIKLPVAET